MEIANYITAIGLPLLGLSFVWLIGFTLWSQRKESKQDDSYIRKTAVKRKVPYITTLAAALAAAKGIDAFRKGRGHPKSLQEYHAGIR